MHAQDDEDEILEEVDVYLSPDPSQQFHLLQYPLQQTSPSQYSSARSKPLHGMLELDDTIPQAIGREGNFQMEERMLTSETIPIRTHMCLGKEKVDPKTGRTSIYLVPLSHIKQMRPSFNQVNEAYLGNGMEIDDSGSGLEDAPEKTPLVFQRKETDRAANMRKSSYAYKTASEDRETWTDLDVFGTDSDEYRSIVGNLMAPSSQQNIRFAKPSDAKYIERLNYLPVPQKKELPVIESSDLQITLTKVITLMSTGGPITYGVIRSRLAADTNITDALLFEALSICAVLVQGNFMLNSKYIAVEKSLQKARTFILLLLNRFGTIERTRLAKVYEDNSLSVERVGEVLKQVCKKEDRCWRLKVEADKHFQEQFPQQTHVYERYWTRQDTRFAKFLELYNPPDDPV